MEMYLGITFVSSAGRVIIFNFKKWKFLFKFLMSTHLKSKVLTVNAFLAINFPQLHNK